MNREDIIRMAREAWLGDTGVRGGFIFFQPGTDGLERFLALAIAAKDAEHQQTLALQQRSYEREIELEVEAEREACAKVCDALAVHPEYASEVTKLAAMAIRARSKE